ncbi:MAG: putative Ig domain-containing protein [Planctomycetes bacterium]|nr:putative Ig domain-containing protein [Planctomycetota bacterium]
MKLLPCLVLLLTLAACGGGGGTTKSSGGGGGNSQAAYDIQVVSPAVNGAQINRPFTVTLNFFEPGTANARNVIASEMLTCTVASGPGSLLGTTSQTGTGGSTLVFSNLVLDTVGTYVLTFSGPNATSPASTSTFNVGAQLDLHFLVTPSLVLTNRVFSVTVQTVTAGTTVPASPGYSLPVTLSLASGGAGTLGGTLTQNIPVAGNSVSFPNLTYSQVGQITLRAAAFGFPDAVSNNITVDGVVMAFATPPASVLVNGTFSLTLNLTSQLTGNPIAPNPGISGTLTVASGGGTLTAGGAANSSGNTMVFSGLRYNQTGNATFTASSPNAASVTSASIAFGVDLQVTATGSTSALPGGNWSAFNFRVVDGNSATWTGSVSNLAWQVLDSGSAQVQSGNVAFASGIAPVTPAPINTPGAYTLTGSITTPNVDSTSIGLTVTSFTIVNQPGPFVALKTCRVNAVYTDTVSSAAPSGVTGYAMLSGGLPTGLTLNGTNGTISGTPTVAGSYSFTIQANTSATTAEPIRCALAVFSATETEITNGQSFKAAGPYPVSGPFIDTWTFTSGFDGISWPQSGRPACRLQIYYPNFSGSPAAPSPAPMLVHHRGRGFVYDDYDNLGAHVASYGYIFVSVEDYQSVYTPLGSAYYPYAPYDAFPSAGGDIARTHCSASFFQEAAMERLLARNAASADALFNRIDTTNIFMAGHSRGGGATHYSHLRNVTLKLKGIIYFMAYDLRNFSQFVAGSATAPAYSAMPTAQPRLPSLIIASENDGDLTYPICDQLIDRATGPTTFATIYGGNHNYLGDQNPDEGRWAGGPPPPYITGPEQKERIFNLVIAFMKRWTTFDRSLEGLLYCNELAGSSEVGVTAWRNMMEQKMLDNHQGGNAAANTLGGVNSISGGTYSTAASLYPNTGNMASLGLRHNIVTIANNATATYTSTIPGAQQNMSGNRRFIFRVGSVDSTSSLKGFDWVNVQVRLTDAQNDQATITLFNPSAPTTTYLPDHPGSGNNVYDRFVEASVMLSAFTAANPALNLNQLTQVQFIFTAGNSGQSRQLYFDDTRFE